MASPFTLSVAKRIFLTPELLQLFLLKPIDFSFKAGQYILINFEGGTHPYSIASSPSQPYLELHIQNSVLRPLNPALWQHFLTATYCEGSGPLGRAYLRPHSGPTLFMAGGSGFSQIKGLLETLLEQDCQEAIYLYWGVREPQHLYLHDLCRTWSHTHRCFYYVPVVSSLSTTWEGRRGLVHEAVVQDLPDLSAFMMYSSGPFAMSQIADPVFRQHGLPTGHFISDALSS